MNYLGITWLKFNRHFPPTEDIVGLWIYKDHAPDIMTGRIDDDGTGLLFESNIVSNYITILPDYFIPQPPTIS